MFKLYHFYIPKANSKKDINLPKKTINVKLLTQLNTNKLQGNFGTLYQLLKHDRAVNAFFLLQKKL